MPNLPSGLRTYEANETVRRNAQNENIEAIDRLFDSAQGHKHTGQPGDAPLIDKDSIASGAVNKEKIANQAVTSEKIAPAAITGDKLRTNIIERKHLRSSGLSSNVAKFKKVTVTGGNVYGEPTTPFTFQDGEGDDHLWSIPGTTPLPQSLTIHLGREYKDIEGMSFASWFGADPAYMPKSFYIEGSYNNVTWTRLYTHSGAEYELFSFIPFTEVRDWRYIRLTVTERKTGAQYTDISCLTVYSRFHGNIDLDVLDDLRGWGLTARLQGLMIMPEGTVTDNGAGVITFSDPLIVMNPAAGTYFRVSAGSYSLGNWGYLYVDLPHQHGAQVTPIVGNWSDAGRSRGYDNKKRIVLAQRQANGNIYFNSAFQARLFGTKPNADKVDGIDFRSSNGFLEYNDGAGWKGVGIKSVQRGTTYLQYNSSITNEYYRYITISPVDLTK